MTYYNIPFTYGVPHFISAIAKRNLQGAIIPDLPPEEGHEYVEAMRKHDLSPIFTFSPTTTDARMRYIASFANGFIYCMARKGVTGNHTVFIEGTTEYLDRCRRATHLLLALGFGVRKKRDIDYLKEKVDIAVIGTQTIRRMEQGGTESVADFVRGLR
jgi:tryptophan synthase alpha chain